MCHRWTTACAVHRGAVDIRRQPTQPTLARLQVGEWRAHAEVASQCITHGARQSQLPLHTALAQCEPCPNVLQVAKEFNASLRCVAGSCRGPFATFSRVDIFNQVSPIFLVTSVGAATADSSSAAGVGRGARVDDGASGLYDDPALLHSLLNEWPVCIHQGRRHRVES